MSHIDRRVLDFERSWWLGPEPKDRAIVDTLGMSAVDYYLRLRAVVVRMEAEAYDPLTVRRLRRILCGAGVVVGG